MNFHSLSNYIHERPHHITDPVLSYFPGKYNTIILFTSFLYYICFIYLYFFKLIEVAVIMKGYAAINVYFRKDF